MASTTSSKTPLLPNNHPGEIILFNFPESVYGRRMVRYLNLRGLPFSQIRVAPNLPRDLLSERLGVKYRRIPIMAVGRDIYLDSRLMLRKLEAWFPEGKLGSEDSFEAGVLEILEEWIIDGGFFHRTAGCIPISAPLVLNEAWMKDRNEGSGGLFTLEALKANRGWCLSQLRIFYGMLEKLLGDGRDWILKTEGPGMAEIHAGWVVDWGVHMAEDMQDEADGSTADMRQALSEKEFPGVHAWVKRFRAAAEAAEKTNEKGGKIEEGKEAEDDVMSKILSAGFEDPGEFRGEEDVLGLKQGQKVSIGPVDFGFAHRDEGILVGLSAEEAVIESDASDGNGKLRLHYPRINFKILPAA